MEILLEITLVTQRNELELQNKYIFDFVKYHLVYLIHIFRITLEFAVA